MTILINDILYKEVDAVIRDLGTVVEVRLNPGTSLIIRVPSKVVSVNAHAVAYTTLRQVYEGLTGDVTEFEYKS